MKQTFQGRALSHDELLAQLRHQGMIIEDDDRARHILTNVSYSRLKSYMIPLMEERNTRKFRYGTTFEHVYTLYGFDRRLRELIFHELEKVEISIRTHIAFASSGNNKGYWYTSRRYFQDAHMHKAILRRIKSELDRTDNDAIKRFREKYSDVWPPCWLMVEATSMGTLSTIYAELRPGRLRREIAAYYGLSDTVFTSLLHHLVYVRNACAHHGRLWNKTLSVKGVLPKNPAHYFPQMDPDAPAHVYYTLCMIKYLQDTVKPENTFGQRLKTLIGNYPLVDIRKMGFPADWKSDPLWSRSRAELDAEMEAAKAAAKGSEPGDDQVQPAEDQVRPAGEDLQVDPV